MPEDRKDENREKGLAFQAPSALKGLGEEALWYAKVEKIGHAIFFCFGQGGRGPLAARVEEKVLDLVEAASFCIKDHGMREELLVRLLELGSLLRIASTVGELGEDNAKILAAELARLSDRIALYSRGSVPSSLFAVEEGGSDAADARLSRIEHLFEGTSTESKGEPAQRRRVSYRTKDMSVTKGQSRTGELTPRSQQILSLVKERGRVSIREVSSLITDCSEKTIQRELASLVDRGLLKKEGERRWSTYMPA